MRIGQGYDIHRLVQGRKLVIGGHVIEHELGPLGHSDGDALLHAVIDALLGATARGDIGKHFPPSDPRYKDMSSLLMLEQIAGMVSDSGYKIANIDSTVILERPKLGPHIPQIIKAMADCLALETRQISVKAKTHEGLGELGQGLAIEAHAVVLLLPLTD